MVGRRKRGRLQIVVPPKQKKMLTHIRLQKLRDPGLVSDLGVLVQLSRQVEALVRLLVRKVDKKFQVDL